MPNYSKEDLRNLRKLVNNGLTLKEAEEYLIKMADKTKEAVDRIVNM